jgi:hypothetical protein
VAQGGEAFVPALMAREQAVTHGGVHNDEATVSARHRELGLDSRASRAGGGAEEIKKGLANGSLMGEAMLVGLRQGRVVNLDDLVRNFAFQGRHAAKPSARPAGLSARLRTRLRTRSAAGAGHEIR